MYVVVLANQKGGVGKSTLTGHLAVEASRSSRGPVVVLDTDPQASAADWWNAREAQDIAFAAVEDVTGLSVQLKELEAAGFKLAFIDTPPQATDTIQAVVDCADVVVIPTRPSPHDLRSVGRTVELCESAGVRPLFVINGAAQRAKITTEAAMALSVYGAVCPVVVHQRTDFASSMTDGRSVQELDAESRSAGEVSKLWDYVSSQLKRVKK